MKYLKQTIKYHRLEIHLHPVFTLLMAAALLKKNTFFSDRSRIAQVLRWVVVVSVCSWFAIQCREQTLAFLLGENKQPLFFTPCRLISFRYVPLSFGFLFWVGRQNKLKKKANPCNIGLMLLSYYSFVFWLLNTKVWWGCVCSKSGNTSRHTLCCLQQYMHPL